MTEAQKAKDEVAPRPTTDIVVDTIALRACRFTDHLFEDTISGGVKGEEAREQETGVDFTAKVVSWHSSDGHTGMVRLLVAVAPKEQPTWSASVEMVGMYSCGENPVLPMERFVRNNGIAYLVPYVRERLASLVSASVFSTYVLPPIGVARILELSRRAEPEEQPQLGGGSDEAEVTESEAD